MHQPKPRDWILAKVLATSFILLFSFYAFPFTGNCKSAFSADKTWFERLKIQSEPLLFIETGSKKFDGHQEFKSYGIPPTAKFRTTKPEEVFRHFSQIENIEKIKQEQRLVAGNLPYITRGKGTDRVSYVNLTGVFFTTSQFAPNNIGVEKNSSTSYIDFTLPPGTEIIELEDGVFLVPGPSKKPEWLTNYYDQWKINPESVPSYVRSSMREIDNEGGIRKPKELPVIPVN